MLCIKRIYEPHKAKDGARYLVDRLWPWGMKKEKLIMDAWLKEVAPSSELRRWFGHDPAKWDEFQRRYREELDKIPRHGSNCWKRLGKVTSPCFILPETLSTIMPLYLRHILKNAWQAEEKKIYATHCIVPQDQKIYSPNPRFLNGVKSF